MRARIIILIASLAALLLCAVPAFAATQDGQPAKFWELDKILPTFGPIKVAGNQQQGGTLRRAAKLGATAFDFPETTPSGLALDRVFSSDDGSDFSALSQAPSAALTERNSPLGGTTELNELQAYRKHSGDASLHITISKAILRAIDERRDSSGCPPRTESGCPLLRGLLLFDVRAYAASAKPPDSPDGDFFHAGGLASLDGHRGHFVVNAGTDPDSAPFWDKSSFRLSGGGQSRAVAQLRGPIDLSVPLDSVGNGEVFGVHVTLKSLAINDRGGESTVLGFIEDPEHVAPGLKTRGLTPLGKPRFPEPRVQPPAGARCTGRPRPAAGHLQLSRDAYAVTEADGFPMVLVTRTGGSRGATTATVTTSGGSARSGKDFKPTHTRVRFENGDTSPRVVEIPILEDRATESQESFTVALTHPQCSTLGKQKTAKVTILDDDQLATPQPAFTIGGSVDGLQGSGLVLSNLGAPLPVSANGSFTLTGTHSTGEPYEVRVASQPHNPDQLCTVQNGTGHVASANITNVSVHCQTTVIPSGLDTSFGSNGRVTTPGNGDGDAVLIQPDGHIVTVGPREVGLNFHFQFGATRHDATGALDPTFGTNGIVTTGLGGNDDKAFDAAMFPDGSFVAVGQADPAGLANTDFGLVRYTADGQLDPAFGTGGKLVSDLSGHDDAARAVAIQPDGKIIAAGVAQPGPGNSDFAIARYNADGTLDTTFGGDGIVTTDMGTFGDDITDIALQPDGKIVAVGVTDQDAVLARYLPDGTLDPTFGNGGTAVGGINTNDVRGLAIAPDGTILVAGLRANAAIVASYAPDGKLNLGFGSFGVAVGDITSGLDSGDDLVVEPDGDIVVVGSASSTTVSDLALIRFKPDGTLDTSVVADLSGFGDFGHALAIDSQGRIVAAGSANDQFGLMRAFL